MYSSLSENLNMDNHEQALKDITTHCVKAIDVFLSCGGVMSKSESITLNRLEHIDKSKEAELHSLEAIYNKITRNKEVTLQPFNMFICSYHIVKEEDRTQAMIIQGRIVIAVSCLNQLRGYEAVISRALNNARLMFIADRKQSILDGLPDFTLPIPRLIEELRSYREELRTGSHYLTAIIALLENHLQSCPIYYPRTSIKKNKLADAKTTKNFTSSLSTVLPDDDEPIVTVHHTESIDGASNLIDPIENCVDQQRRNDYFEATVIASKSITTSLKLQNQVTKNAMQQMLKREKQLSTDYRQLTKNEIKGLIDYWFTQKEQAYDLIILSLFIGMPISDIFKHKDTSLKISNHPEFAGHPIWTFKPQVPTHPVHKTLEKLLVRSTGNVIMKLPKRLLHTAKDLKQNRLSLEEVLKSVTEILKNVNAHYNSRLTPARISSYLSFYLIRNAQDSTEVAFLQAQHKTPDPGCYYYQVPVTHLISIYESYLSHLSNLSKKLEAPLVKQKTNLEVGSNLQITHEVLKELFKQLVERIELYRDKDWTDIEIFHNTFTLYSLLLLNICTGHRAVNNPYHTLDCFDLETKTVFICDKDIGGQSSARIVPLPDIVCAQVGSLVEHRNNLIRFFNNVKPSLAAEIEGRYGMEPPLFFFLEKNKFVPVTSKAFNKHLEHIFPIKLNWNRHFMRTWLRKNNIQGNIVDSWMGHIGSTGDSFAHLSGLSMNDLRNVADIINLKLLSSLNIRIVKPWRKA